MRILYLDLDTLRADHLGCYGYPRRTSSNIDRIAQQGVRFDHYYCSDAPCLPSRTALMTGRFGIHSGVVGHGGTGASLRIEGPERDFRDRLATASLPAFLKGQGLHTTYIGGFGERHSAWWFYAGFREIHDSGLAGMETAAELTPSVLDWISRNAQQDDWYLHVTYWDPHTPYRTPLEFGNPFEGEPLPYWFNEEVIRRHRLLPGPHTAQDLGMYHNQTDPRYPRNPGEIKDMTDLRRVINAYDTGIAYMDHYIGRIFEVLERAGVMDDLAIIISADHGENFGELGMYAEHGTADEYTCRVPLIVRWPGAPAGAVDDSFHYNLDLLPTLADLFDQPSHPTWEGQSFASVIRSGQESGRSELVLSQGAHVCQRSVRWDDWLYMHTYHDGFHLFPDEMLYNLKEDPHEQVDVAAAQPGAVQEGRERLARWHSHMMEAQPKGYTKDPLQIVLEEGGPFHARGHLPQYLARLEATGRGDAIEPLRKKHPQEFQ